MIKICPAENLVLDANIIISAVFGPRMRNILEHPKFKSKINICSPAVILEEVEKNVPKIADRKHINLDICQNSLISLKERLTIFHCQHVYKRDGPGSAFQSRQ